MITFVQEDFYVFDKDMNIVGIMPNIISLVYKEKHQGIGDFEMQVALTKETVKMSQTENIIVFDYDKGIAGVIGKIEEQINSEGNRLNISGNLCEEYLSRRICWGLYSKTGLPSQIISDMVNVNIISPTDDNRKIDNFEDITGTIEGEKSISFQSTGGILSENIVSICEANDLGFRLKVDLINKKLKYETYKGIDRTINQNKVPQCVFSLEFENITSALYSKNVKDSKNVFLVAGEGEGKDRKTVTVGDTNLKGKERIEYFVDARDLQSVDDEGATIPENEYLQMLTQRGEESKSEYKVVENFECEINPFGNLVYDKDFFLGDKVTAIIDLFNLKIDVIITEASHTITYEGESVSFTFGYSALTLTNKLRKMVKR